MRTWIIVFEQNGGEYHGTLIVTGKELAHDYEKSRCSFVVDNVTIEIDEEIVSVTEVF